MAASSKYHIKIASSSGEKGFTTKKYSSRQRPDSLFGSRFTTGDVSYSTMNRWQRLAQSTWLNGAFQKYWEDEARFRLSNNIDVLSYGEFKLSKKLGTVLHEGSSSIAKGIYYNGAHYFAEGRYLKYTTDNFQNVSTSKDFGAGTVISDLEIHDGKLWASVGTVGIWYHTTSDHVTWTELKDGAVTIPCNYIKSWGDNLFITYINILKYYDGSTITLVNNFSTGGDSAYYLKKPNVYAGKLIIPINIVGSSIGRGEVWYYDGTNLDIIWSGFDPVGQNTIVYNSLLLFVTYGLEKMTIKQYDGSNTYSLQSFSISEGTAVYGSGIKYGSGAIYGAGTDKYDDPVEFSIWKENLVVIIKRTTYQNTMLIFDTFGFTEYLSLPTGSNYYACMWLYDRDLFIGGSDGDIYKVSENYAAEGFLQGSIWDANLQDIEKLFADIIVKHDPIESGDSIEVWYRTENSGGFQLLGTNDEAESISTTVSFPTGANTVLGTRLEYKIILKSYDGSTSPNVLDVIVRYILAPENEKRVFEYTIQATKKMRLLDKTFETRTPAEIISDLWGLKLSGELLTLTDENEEDHTVVFSDTTPEVITPFSGDDETEKYVYVRLFEL